MKEIRDDVRYIATWKIEKYLNCAMLAEGKPYEISVDEGNVLLNEGITALLTLLIGGAETAYSNANAQLGVGNSNTAAASTQTDLQGGSTAWAAMDATYPQVSGQIVTFRSTFGSGDANFAWEEMSARNGASANKNLNRKVSSKGTKVAGEVWVLTLTVELS
jgi:hypothetical protein